MLTAGSQREQFRVSGQIPVGRGWDQRIAKLFLTAVLGPFEPVEGLYYFREPYQRRRRAE